MDEPSKLAELKAASDLRELARLLGFKPSALAFVLYRQSDVAKYKTFEIPKRRGGARTINAPIDALKVAQRKLADLLQDCIAEIHQAKGTNDRIVHGFARQKSIITNAHEHRKRHHVLNLDLKDFFPSINFGRVRGFFLKDRDYLLNKDVATAIAQIACYQNALPQGSPCSPVISNLVGRVLDLKLMRLASQTGCTYTRYADDLSFSTNKPVFPKEIAVAPEDGSNIWTLGEALLEIIDFSGFQVNPQKTRMQYRDSRQEVTGLVVNRKVNLSQHYRRTVRAMVHNLYRKGSFEIASAKGKEPGTLDQLHGMLGFIYSIDLENSSDKPQKSGAGKGSKKKKNNNDTPCHPSKRPVSDCKTEMYRRFLLYKDFYACEKPVVLCEGATDNVYLVHAIRALAGSFPELATTKPDGKIELKVRLYKYPQSSTAKILKLNDGGWGPLKNFIETFDSESRRFYGPGKKHPVIVLYDNDAAARNIVQLIRNIKKIPITGEEPYVHVTRNLYGMPIPRQEGAKDSEIEDLFDASLKETLLDGKKFNSAPRIDGSKEYGKNVFAHRVIVPNASKIDFTKFAQLLANMASIIREYQQETGVSNA